MALSFYASDCRRQISEAVAKAIKKGEAWDLELPFVTAKGRDIWVRSAGRAVVEDGRTARLVGAFQDITERKRSEQLVRQAEAVQRTTLETLREGILVLSRSGRIQSFNTAAAALLGYAGENLKGRKVQDLKVQCYTEEGDLDPDLLHRAARAPETVNNHTARFLLSDQEHPVWLRIDANATDGASAMGLDASIISLADISETKRQAETLQAVLDNLPGGLVYYDEDRHLSVCNDEYIDLMKLPRELVDKRPHIRDMFTYLANRGDYGPGDAEEQVSQRLSNFENPEPHTYERAAPDGRIVEVRGVPLPNGALVASFSRYFGAKAVRVDHPALGSRTPDHAGLAQRRHSAADKIRRNQVCQSGGRRPAGHVRPRIGWQTRSLISNLEIACENRGHRRLQ